MPRQPHRVASPRSPRYIARALWLAAVFVVLGGCDIPMGPSAPASGTAPGLRAAVTGLCAALSALPDRSAAERAFTNLAHESLHGLAADPRLDRATSAGVLEAMQVVEQDFRRSADADALSRDLGVLRDSAAAALTAIGDDVRACDG
jgi:hypothetical protein